MSFTENQFQSKTWNAKKVLMRSEKCEALKSEVYKLLKNV